MPYSEVDFAKRKNTLEIHNQGCRVTNEAIKMLSENCRLQKVQLANCKTITETALQALSNRIHPLHTISLGYAPKLSTNDVTQLAKNATFNLRKVDFRECKQVTGFTRSFSAKNRSISIGSRIPLS
jgi:hypothetical protein